MPSYSAANGRYAGEWLAVELGRHPAVDTAGNTPYHPRRGCTNVTITRAI